MTVVTKYLLQIFITGSFIIKPFILLYNIVCRYIEKLDINNLVNHFYTTAKIGVLLWYDAVVHVSVVVCLHCTIDFVD